MTPTVRIDQEVWDELQKRAEPFVDNPNSVLRRLLRLDQSKGKNGRKSAKTSKRAKAVPFERHEKVGRDERMPLVVGALRKLNSASVADLFEVLADERLFPYPRSVRNTLHHFAASADDRRRDSSDEKYFESDGNGIWKLTRAAARVQTPRTRKRTAKRSHRTTTRERNQPHSYDERKPIMAEVLRRLGTATRRELYDELRTGPDGLFATPRRIDATFRKDQKSEAPMFEEGDGNRIALRKPSPMRRGKG